MTTDVKVVFANDLYCPNEILNLQIFSNCGPSEICLNGVSFQSTRRTVDEPLGSVCMRASIGALNWIASKEMLSKKPIIFFVSHDCWLDSNAINLHKKLWKSLQKRMPVIRSIKTDGFPEIVFSNTEGKVRFAGLLPVVIDKFGEFTEIIRTVDSAFIIIGDLSITEKTISWLYDAAFVEADKIVNSVNWHKLCQKVCADSNVIVRASGRFNDREASIDLFYTAGKFGETR